MVLDPVALVSGGSPALSGRVQSRGGLGFGAAQVDAVATPRDGPYQLFEYRGHVPDGATHAVIGVRINHEGVGPGSAGLTFYEFGYSEMSSVNLVPRPHFETGLAGWGPWGDGSLSAPPSDRGSGLMLHAVATSAQSLGFNSDGFGVVPGAAYRFWLAGRIPEASIGSAYVAVIFLSADLEVRRDVHPLAPAAIELGAAAADSFGRFSLTSAVLEPGRYWLRATYPGDASRWPAWADADVAVP
jgi:hypothetical protein